MDNHFPTRIVRPSVPMEEFGLEPNDVGVIRSIEGQFAEVQILRLRKSFDISLDELRPVNPKEFGDLFREKICNVCHRILPVSNFDLNQNGKGDRPVRRPSCKDCRRSIDGISISATDRKTWNSTKPDGVDFECPICSKVTIAGVTAKVVLNHDHATGQVLGWICDSCNTGLGRFKDDEALLRRAIEYLREHKRN